MDEGNTAASQNYPYQDTNDSTNRQVLAAITLTFLLVILGFIGFYYIKKSTSTTNQNVLNASTNQLSPTQTLSPTPQTVANTAITTTPAATTFKACSKNGPAQKWEYLVPYIVKDGDDLQSIAKTQLNDESRVNEILQLNGTGPYVVGSTIYLPPSFIKKSSGNIKEVYGLLIEKDTSYWHLSYSSDPKGMGILIPSYWFNDVSNSASFTSGDCVSVLLDDGNKVFSVTSQ